MVGSSRRAVHVLMLLAVAGCTCKGRVRYLDTPEGVFTRNQEALAFRVSGASGSTRPVSVSLTRLRRQGHDLGSGTYLLARSNGRVWSLSHRRDGDFISADLVAGEYVAIARPVGRLAHSYLVFCRLLPPYWQFTEKPDLELPRLCHLILCAPEIMTPKEFLDRYPAFERAGVEFPEGPIGGWLGPHTGICEECTRFRGGEPPELIIPALECWLPKAPCSEGTLLLQASFQSDTPGSSPATDLPGAPVGDRFEALPPLSSYEVIDSGPLGSQALELNRASPHTRADFVLSEVAGGASSYCVAFRGHAGNGPNVATLISIVSAGSVDAEPTYELCRLIIEDGTCTLISGDPPLTVPGDFGPGQVHEFHIDIDLALKRFTLQVDGDYTTEALPFLDPDAGSFSRVRFDYIPCILECFPGQFVVDDLRVRRTS